MAAVTKKGRAGLRRSRRAEPAMAAIGKPRTPACLAEGGPTDKNGVGKRIWPGMEGDRGGKRTKIRGDFHADPVGILVKGLGNGPVIGYGCVVVMGQQAC